MEALRQIPPVTDILNSPELEPFRPILGQPFVGRLLDEILTDTRNELVRNGKTATRIDLTASIAGKLLDRLHQSTAMSLRRVINATGVVLHTNLGRAPLPAESIDHLRNIATGYSNLEYGLEEGTRGSRDGAVEVVLEKLVNCESASVVNNNAAAVLLVLNSLAEGGEVVVSRGELVEIGGSFRVPEIMAKSGAVLCDVGTTNRTRIQDYESAITSRTRLLLRVHPSNFRVVGFTERPTLDQFVALGRRHSVPTCEDLGSGYIARSLGILPEEPSVTDSVRAGVDMVCFSGDKLLGGPQAGIIVGKSRYIDQIKRNPLFRALRVDKLTLPVLESVLLTHLSGRLDDLPIWRMMRATPDSLKQRADALARQLGDGSAPVPLSSVVGGGSAPNGSCRPGEYPLT
jgi:L-seryl-tRNA(Ser) seleniumtransferase